MAHILAGILSLKQHVFHLRTQPEAYRPDRCPHCRSAGLWQHGHYVRQADRRPASERLDDTIHIPRYFCPDCGRTCSCLPEAIPPGRWYLWAEQQIVLLLLLNGASFSEVSRQRAPCRQTIRRWWASLQARFALHAATLRSRFPALGRAQAFRDFWPACLAGMSLSQAMCQLHRDGVLVP